MDRESVLPIAAKIKTPEDELQVLAELAETAYFVVLKRTVRRFVELNKNAMFLLNKDDPKLVSKMGDLKAEAGGMNKLIRLVEQARTELAKRNGDSV